MSALNANERSIMAELRGTNANRRTDSVGGFLVPQGFQQRIDIATLFTGEVERLAKKLNTAGGALLDYPTINDTATDAGLTAEAAAVTCSRYDIRKRSVECLQLRITSSCVNAIVARQRIRFERIPC